MVERTRNDAGYDSFLEILRNTTPDASQSDTVQTTTPPTMETASTAAVVKIKGDAEVELGSGDDDANRTMQASTVGGPGDSTNGDVRRRPTTAMAVVGGSLIITSAALATLGLINLSNDQENGDANAQALSIELLPTSSPIQSPSIFPSMSNPPSERPSISSQPSMIPSALPTDTGKPSLMASNHPSTTPSSTPSEQPSVTTEPTTTPSSSPSNDPTVVPSTQPTFSPSVSLAPTYHPTFSPTISSRPTQSPTSKPTESPTEELLFSISSTGTFRLRLHWEPGFYWQEDHKEMWYCMACAWCNPDSMDGCSIRSVCKENMMLAMVGCKPKDLQKSDWTAKFTLARGARGNLFGDNFIGDQIQVHNTNLCMERSGTHSNKLRKEIRNVSLKPCNSTLERQRFTGFRSGGQAMELIPEGSSFTEGGVQYDRCLTQHHHPRTGERVFAENCRLARISDTNLWSTY